MAAAEVFSDSTRRGAADRVQFREAAEAVAWHVTKKESEVAELRKNLGLSPGLTRSPRASKTGELAVVLDNKSRRSAIEHGDARGRCKVAQQELYSARFSAGPL
jgi:hypothetical protein